MLYDKLITDHLSCKRPVLTNVSHSWTYRELDTSCAAVAEIFRRRNVQKGDRIFIIAEHSIRTVIVVLACFRLGACAVPLPEQISKRNLNLLVADASPRLVVGTEVPLSVDSLSFTSPENMLPPPSVSVPPTETDPENLAYILYTSGSTGKPKGVMAQESQVLFCIDAINRRLENTQNDRILCVLPLSFDYGLYQVFLALAAECSLILPPSGPLQATVAWLRKARITEFPAMPAMLNMLLKTHLLERVSLPDLRCITSTGDFFPVETIRHLQSVLPQTQVIPMYGLTECKRVSIMPSGRLDKTMAGSCGKPLDGVQVRIQNPDSNGVGELVVSGKNVMAGYWDDPEATARDFFFDSVYGNSLRTGDLFRIDEDGFLYFVGRKKRIIKVNGYRIGALELEEQIQEELGDLLEELRVMGMQDSTCGERVAVWVSSKISAEILIARLKELASDWPAYQRPHMLFCTKESFPRTENGKIDETALSREMKNHVGLKIF